MKKHFKHIMLLTSALLAVTSCSNESITGTGKPKQEVRNFSEFKGINVSGNYEILGSPGKPEKFIISTNENILPYILTSVKKGVLTVESKKSVSLHPTVTQNIWFTVPEFNSLELSGSSIFQFLDLNGDELKITLSGSHHLLLTGKATSIDLTISGSSDVDARKLNVDDAKVVINGSSTVYLNPANNLKVTINGEGKVVYFSEAPKVEQVINGAGQVISNFGKIDKEVDRTKEKF